MRKLKIIILMLLVSSILYTGCEKELSSANVTTKITTYAVITLNGDNPIYVPKGSTYTEPGATTNTGDPITINSTVDVNSEGVYTIDYTSVNIDGYPYTIQRTVVVSEVADTSIDISGTYEGLVELTSSLEYRASNITISSTDITGLFYISDLYAGVFSDALALGSSYRVPGFIRCEGYDVYVLPNIFDFDGYPVEGYGIIYPDGRIEMDYGWTVKFQFLKEE